MADRKRVLPLKAQFSYDACQILADFNHITVPDYRELYDRYPVGEGIRDISICMSNRATDAEHIIEDIRAGKYTWGCIGWLVFYPGFVMAAEEKGMTAFEYADWLYANCNAINEEVGFRAAWIEAYGEIGNSMMWPNGKKYTKKECLQYLRNWLREGNSLSEHWRYFTPKETASYYTHAKTLSDDLRTLPMAYSEGTLFALHEAYELGFPMVVYEGHCGTPNRVQTGIAFVRGGAKMYDAFWGLDFSAWELGLLGTAIDINRNGNWREGMTPEYMMRLWIAGYMSGCNSMLHEVSYEFFYANPAEGLTILSDYGMNAMKFFGMTKGSLYDRGKQLVPFAVMLEEEHGYRGDSARVYDPETGRVMGSDKTRYTDDYELARKRLCTWQFRLEDVTDGDWQVQGIVSSIWQWPDNGLKPYAEEFPLKPIGNWPGGKLPEMRTGYEEPADYDRFLADSKWADCFDFITEKAGADVIEKYYKALILGGEIRTDNGLWPKLTGFVAKGGTIVASVDQLTDEALAELGIKLSGPKSAQKLNKTGEAVNLQRVEITGDAKVLESEQTIDELVPLAAEFKLGGGKLIVIFISYAIDTKTKKMSSVFTRVIDSLYKELAGVWYSGPGCEMIVCERDSDTVVTLLNHTGNDWEGIVHAERAGRNEISAVRDVIADENISDRHILFTDKYVEARVKIPRYGYKVISFGQPADYKDRIESAYKDPSVASEESKRIAAMQAHGTLEKVGTVEQLRNRTKKY